MLSIQIELIIYNLPLGLIVTLLGVKPLRFKVAAKPGHASSMTLKYLPDDSWIAEKSSMKFFTKSYIEQLGLVIKNKKPEWFHLKNDLKLYKASPG